MPKGYSIKLVAEAQTQLRSIANDEFRKRMNPNTAIKNVRKLMDAIISLSYGKMDQKILFVSKK